MHSKLGVPYRWGLTVLDLQTGGAEAVDQGKAGAASVPRVPTPQMSLQILRITCVFILARNHSSASSVLIPPHRREACEYISESTQERSHLVVPHVNIDLQLKAI